MENSYQNIQGYEGKIILEVCIEKYRDISVEREDISSDKAYQIATMQSAHQSILEYLYQFTLAEDTQQKLSEACYTIFITVISTVVCLFGTYGISSLASNFNPLTVLQQGSSTTLQNIAKVAQAIMAPIIETLEEVYVDPFIEGLVSGAAEDAGLDATAQLILSGLAESGRETFFGIISKTTDVIRSMTSIQTSQNLQIVSQHQEQVSSRTQQEQEQSQANREARNELLTLTASSLLMFAGAFTGGVFGSIGSTLGGAALSIGTVLEGADNMKETFTELLKAKRIELTTIVPDSQVSDAQLHEVKEYVEQEIVPETATFSTEQKQRILLQPKYPFGKYDSPTNIFGVDSKMNQLFRRTPALTASGTTYAFINEKEMHMIRESEGNNPLDTSDPLFIKSEILTRADQLVKYDKKAECRRTIKSKFIRHNYRRYYKYRLICTDCKKVLVNPDPKLENTLYHLSKIEMNKKDMDKDVMPLGENGDITIYRIYLKKEALKNLPNAYSRELLNNLIKKFHISPQLSYVGQTVGHAIDRFNGHKETAIYDSMEPKRTWFEAILRKYADFTGHDSPSEIAAHIDSLFEVEVLQVIKAKETQEETQKVADEAEEFWVGWTHSQFIEFGWNYEQGGRRGRLAFTRIDPVLLDDIIERSLLIPKVKKPLEWVLRQLSLGKKALTQNIEIIYEAYGANSYYDIRYLKLVERMTLLAEQGYQKWEIGFLLGSEAQSRTTIAKQVGRWFNEIFPNVEYSTWQAGLISRRILSLIERGFTTPYDIATHFEGLDTQAIFNFMSIHLSEYLYCLLISLFRKGHTSISSMESFLQIRSQSISPFLTAYGKKMSQLKEHASSLASGFVYGFERNEAIRHLLNYNNERQLLIKLGYKRPDLLTYFNIKEVIRSLFNGLDFQRAKRFYVQNLL